MPRPRLYDRDLVLDAAESLAVQTGPAGVTTRAVASAAGVSNGADLPQLSVPRGPRRPHVVACCRGFLSVQGELVDAALTDPAADPVDAVVAAADAPAVYYGLHPQSARLLVRVNRSQLLGDAVSDEVAAELAALDAELVALLVRLAHKLWNRRDAAAVDAVTLCVVDLPTAFLLSRHRIDSEWARLRLGSAVRATLADGPPPRPSKTKE